ncbi:Saposin [Hexamita inflata]|uniref:Putative n=1 Tax=Hexamita inflata TaxID=28002 RepID=A0AA86RWX4_9EUKA|nr:Saposin [Hexamita inflata]
MFILIINVFTLDNQCSSCEVSVQELYDSYESGAGEQQLITYFQNICLSLPDMLQMECIFFVPQEVPKLIKLVERQIPVETVCTLLTACNYPILPINAKCDICVVMFTFVEDLPAGFDLEVFLESICEIFQEEEKDQCHAFIKQEYNNIIDYISKNYSPEQVCEQLEVCDK